MAFSDSFLHLKQNNPAGQQIGHRPADLTLAEGDGRKGSPETGGRDRRSTHFPFLPKLRGNLEMEYKIAG